MGRYMPEMTKTNNVDTPPGNGEISAIEKALRQAPHLSKPVPRYTSFPTAPHFHAGVNATQYEKWLHAVPRNEGISVYIHIPFCDRLCWFCGCHTKMIQRYDPIPVYLKSLEREIALVRGRLGFAPRISQLHLGGGSPSLLRGADLLRLRETLENHFRMDVETQISMEIDPSDMTGAEFADLKAFGITRASIGVQDFDEKVQRAINRPQTFEHTAHAVSELRGIGVRSVNIDALYGLPYQTLETIETGMHLVTSLKPDRVALFGYAHVPWVKTHQKMIPEDSLPGPEERLKQAQTAAALLQADDYLQIGIDHFARPDDGLSIAATTGRLRRNFQGYTDDPCSTLIGLGASSIGRLPTGYVQNHTPTAHYMREISEGRLPIARGVAFTPQDRLDSDIIEDLMCRFETDISSLRKVHGDLASDLSDRMQTIVAADADNLVQFDGNRLVIPPTARPFTRTVASWFDSRLMDNKAQYSIAV